MQVGTRTVTSVAVTVAGVALVRGAGGASPDPPEGGCPSGWSLVPTALSPERQGDDRDENNNGLVCMKRQCDGPSDCTVMVRDDVSREGG